MAIFNDGDKVYFPIHSSRILTVERIEERRDYPLSVQINSEQGYSFTVDGKFHKNHVLPSIFHATKENQQLLGQLYGIAFQEVPKPPTSLEIIEQLLKSQHAVTCVVSNDPITEITDKIAVILSIEYGNVRKFIDGFGLCWKYARAVDISKGKPTFIDKGLEILEQI